MNNAPFWKITATTGGIALTGAAVWMNATHIAEAEGWASPLVAAGIIVTLCAAVAPPSAERAAKASQPFKAACLWLFFALAVLFSLSASIARSSGYADGKVASADQLNMQTKLAEEGYAAAQEAHKAECASGRGPRCRDAEDAVKAARKALAAAAPVQATDPGAARLAAVLGIEEELVQLYLPLLLPLGLELGGFIFLAFGLAPRRREDAASPIETIAIAIEPAAIAIEAPATPMQTIAKAAAKAPAAGTRAYYLQRLQREFPAIAKRVEAGELSVHRACIEAGLRKEPAKSSKWTSIEAYAPARADA